MPAFEGEPVSERDPVSEDEPVFIRYVAIGDSTTEGLDEPDGHGGYRGWADRLADHIAEGQDEPLEYANLAIRGHKVGAIRTTQFDAALAFEPDLMTIVGGMNDVIGLRPDFDQLAESFEAMFGQARQAGITVLTFTMPDPGALNPLGRVFRHRMMRLNDIVSTTAQRHGVEVMDFTEYPIAVDPRLWSDDRLHGNSLGHQRVAAALAWQLGVSGVDDSWTEALETPEQIARRRQLAGDWDWAVTYLAPWLGRGIRGIPRGLGIGPKRPVPTEVRR